MTRAIPNLAAAGGRGAPGGEPGGRVPAVRRVRGGPPVLVALCVAALGCAVVWPSPLDLPPGHRAVLGRIDLRSEAREALIEIVREDGAFRHDLRVGPGQRDFAIALPPGRYWILRLRLSQDRQTVGSYPIRELRITFEVGPEPAVYIGTLQLVATFGDRVEIAVVDEYENTVPALRARHPDIAEPVRSLLRPA